jgi:hypothetical protein
VTLVYVPGKQIAPGKLVSAMLALVRSIASVRSHVACYMLRTSKSCVADGAFVIASHLEKRKGEREMVVG